jgi:hypothetical protein
MLEVIRELREAGLAIFAMSNISAPDWEVLTTKATVEEWALFDHTLWLVNGVTLTDQTQFTRTAFKQSR